MAGYNDIGLLEKRAGESRLYNMSFSLKCARGEVIDTINSLTSTPTTSVTALTVGAAVASGQQIQFRISGGQAGGKYLQVGIVTTDLGNILQCEGYLVVRSIPGISSVINTTITPSTGGMGMVGV